MYIIYPYSFHSFFFNSVLLSYYISLILILLLLYLTLMVLFLSNPLSLAPFLLILSFLSVNTLLLHSPPLIFPMAITITKIMVPLFPLPVLVLYYCLLYIYYISILLNKTLSTILIHFPINMQITYYTFHMSLPIFNLLNNTPLNMVLPLMTSILSTSSYIQTALFLLTPPSSLYPPLLSLPHVSLLPHLKIIML